MNDAPKHVARHSARRAGVKQRKVPKPFFEALVATQRRAEVAEARAAELDATLAEIRQKYETERAYGESLEAEIESLKVDKQALENRIFELEGQR